MPKITAVASPSSVSGKMTSVSTRRTSGYEPAGAAIYLVGVGDIASQGPTIHLVGVGDVTGCRTHQIGRAHV